MSHPHGTHPVAHRRHRTPGPATGAPPDGKDAHGPVGMKAAKAKPVSPLLASPPITITAEILGEIVDTKNIDANKVAQNLNATVTAAKITTALAQAMLIAQLVVESGSFTKETVTEGGAENYEIYNPRTDLAATFKQSFSGKNDLQRYLHGAGQMAKWQVSKAAYDKAKAVFDKANPGKDFNASGAWTYTHLTDYIPQDVRVMRAVLWYDPESPFTRRANLAKSMKNVTAGDGLKFIGRGYIQLTWRTNYLDAGKFIGLDLEADPKLAADPVNSIKISAWFWNHSGCNRKANADTDEAFVKVSEAINGARNEAGVIGMAARRTSFGKVKDALTKRLPPTAAPQTPPTAAPQTPPPAVPQKP